MVDKNELEKFYLQELDKDIIEYISKFHNFPLADSMNVYYKSRLCNLIHQKKYGIENLDYKLLVEEYLDFDIPNFIGVNEGVSAK